MARKRKGQPIDGWLSLDKPLGLSSAQAVAQVRRLFDAAKVGHGGTLDPLATGVLPIALGEATKTVQYVMDGAKAYRWTVRWGIATSSDDGEGEVIETAPGRPDRAAILAALPSFTGSITQVPPIYSAIKVAGERAYDLARAGETVELAARQVRIDRFELVEQPDDDHAVFEVACGKGTYIRSLARDLARALGTVGHVTALRRILCGPFDEARSISLEALRELGQGADLRSCLLPIETALDDIPALALTDADARRLQSGGPVPLARAASFLSQAEIAPDTPCRAMAGGRLVALVRIEDGLIRPVRVMVQSRHEGVDDVDHP